MATRLRADLTVRLIVTKGAGAVGGLGRGEGTNTPVIGRGLGGTGSGGTGVLLEGFSDEGGSGTRPGGDGNEILERRADVNGQDIGRA